jgi:quinoprotein glucose dehydrogenase
MRKTFAILVLPLIAGLFACRQRTNPYAGWPVYGGSTDGIRYSSLTTIDTNNVAQLQVAWTYHTGDADTTHHSQIQCNPVIINNVLYGTSPQLKLIALNAATGQLLWSFNPSDSTRDSTALHFILNNNRGVAYWTDGKKDDRILYTAGYYLYALDAKTGTPVDSFGHAGKVDLHEGLGSDAKDRFITATSPGIIYNNLFILGSRVDEGPTAAPGHIRAFDIHTGQVRWIFHTIPQPGEYGYDTWDDPQAYKHTGGANSWSGFTLDQERGILFAPTGSASFDFYGGKRRGQNLFANCLLALDAATGKRKWHFQFIHHDLWDMDIPAPPALVTLTKNGQPVDAVAQTTKHGMVWLFERETGKPVYPIEEKPVDTNTTLLYERVWPTQPIPAMPKPFVRQTFTADDINPHLPDSSVARLKEALRGYRYGHMFIPPGKQTSVVFPGYDGGAEWGGPSFDPATGILYVNANEMGWLLTIRDNKPMEARKENLGQAGKRLYEQHCTTCHGADRKGSGNNPSLTDIPTRYKEPEVFELLNTGRRMMPAFKQLEEQEKAAISAFIMNAKAQQQKPFTPPAKAVDTFRQLPYSMTGYYKFISAEGYPAIKPPWGTLSAIDLNTGLQVWKTTLGEYPELKAQGVPPTGTENYGGPVVTAGGVLFIAAARDGKFRAFNKRTGKLLWEYDLPAPGFATPAVYAVNNKQYIVIACGGGKLGTPSGDTYLAFSLPPEK